MSADDKPDVTASGDKSAAVGGSVRERNITGHGNTVVRDSQISIYHGPVFTD